MNTAKAPEWVPLLKSFLRMPNLLHCDAMRPTSRATARTRNAARPCAMPASRSMIRFVRGNVKPDTPLLYLLPIFGVLLLILIWSALSDYLASEHDRVVRNAVSEAASHARAFERSSGQLLRAIDQATRLIQREFERSQQGRDPFDLAAIAKTALGPLDMVSLVSVVDKAGNATVLSYSRAQRVALVGGRRQWHDRGGLQRPPQCRHAQALCRQARRRCGAEQDPDSDDPPHQQPGRIVWRRRGGVGRPRPFHRCVRRRRTGPPRPAGDSGPGRCLSRTAVGRRDVGRGEGRLRGGHGAGAAFRRTTASR